MNYKIKVRKVNPEDFPKPTNKNISLDEYNKHLHLLVEDISKKQKIEKVSLDKEVIYITSSLNNNLLLEEELKDLFGREIDYIYYLSTVELV